VNFSDKPKPKEPLYPETEYKLFVGNLSWNVTSEILTQAFQEHGTVVGARVLYDGETGRSRGYGFVSYANKSEMEAALTFMDNVVCYFSSIHSFMRRLFVKKEVRNCNSDGHNFFYVFVTTM
jgi:RNA recognition motif-containing protein